jgi:hypothetical protein
MLPDFAHRYTITLEASEAFRALRSAISAFTRVFDAL